MHLNQIRAGLSLIGISIFPTLVATNSISRDVVIVGGGASGAHAAVWLRDHGKSVVVVEKRDTLVRKFSFVSITPIIYYS